MLMRPAATLAELLPQDSPKHAAVIVPEGDITIVYEELARQVEGLAATLRESGLQPGDALGIVLPNGLECLVAFLAATRARLVAAPLTPAYKPEEFQFYFSAIGVRAL